MFTRAPTRPARRPAESGTTAPAETAAAGPPTTPTAPFIRPQQGALPPPARPLELPAPREPVLRTWHMPGPAESPAEERPGPGEPGESTQGRTEVPWEVEAMTSPDYKAARSIHDPQHDSWPVAAPDGTAEPAWPDEQELELTDEVEAGSPPMELTDGVDSGEAGDDADQAIQLDLADVVETEAPEPTTDRSADAGTPVEVPYVETEREPGATFPLDAFIVPTGVEHVPAGYLEDMSGAVAARLEALAQQIRREGIQSVGKAGDADELAHVLAAIVAGYLARHA